MKRRAALLLLAGAALGAAAPLASRVERLLEGSPAARGAFWGIQVVDLASGQTLYELNPHRSFVPASNTKLFTTALGLLRLGAEHRFSTAARAEREPDAAGRIGSLRLVGGGDANLSARAIPYRTGPVTGNPLAPIEELAGQVVARGVKRVDGDIVGDDTEFIWEPYPEGWAMADAVWEYGAPVSALTLHDNAFRLSIVPGETPGDLARLSLVPPLEHYYRIDNRIRTTAAGERKIQLARDPGSRQLRLWGAIPLRDAGTVELLGIEDPALYAAHTLYQALTRRGVSISGRPLVEHVLPNQVTDLENGPTPPPLAGVELARRSSAPLIEDLRITDKVSQNLHAELILRAVGRARRNIGSREAGLAEMQAFLEEIGMPREEWQFHDGSGLSRLNLVTPAAVIALLRYMYASSQRENWLSLLPVAGQDGTLGNRLGAGPAAGRVRAKTGTLSHVMALSGYAQPPGGAAPLAFTILVNNFGKPSSEIRATVDKICMTLFD